ncbi:MAG: hypothetical protein HY471_02910 [Candidatus Sungbacteria bacterium]|nr:hypothetical protein [Candidatus Sungbacteria bacterium]
MGERENPLYRMPRNPFRVLTFRDWIYIPHLLGRRERAILGFFLALALIGGITTGTVALQRFTSIAPEHGGTFKEGVTRLPERVNPLFLASNDTDRDLVELIFAKLFSYDSKGSLIPDIAKSYEVGDDGRTYTIALRADVLWHDGVPLTVDDVLFTIRAIQDPAYKSSLRPNWQGVTAERLGDHTMRILLKQSYSPFIQNLALPVIPKHIWERIPAEAATLVEVNIKPIGAGPYRVKKIVQTDSGIIDSYVLEAYDDYHREGPYIKTIEFSFYEDEEAMLRAYQSGAIDGISILSAKNLELAKSMGAEVHAIRMPRVFGIFLNEANPSLKELRVRQALALAIPKDALIETALGGGAIPVDTPIPPGTFGYNPDVAKTPFNPEQARSLLEKTGWKDQNRDGIREKAASKKGEQPTPLKITLVTSDWKDLIETANAVKAYWREIGVDTEVRSLPISDLESEAIRPRKYDALLFGEILGRDPDPFAFWHSSQLKDPGLNIALYHSPKVDSLLESARRATNRAEIEAKYKEFQKVVDNDFPTIFLYSPTYFYATRPVIKGIELESLVVPSERFDSLYRWFIETRREF